MAVCSCSEPAAHISGGPLHVQPTNPAAAWGIPTTDGITQTLSHVRNQLDSRMVLHMSRATSNSSGNFAVEAKFEAMGYPGAVMYAGILAAGDATGDKSYDGFIARRFQFFADTIPLAVKGTGKNPYAHWISPRSLDDCGAMGAAMIKARRGRGSGS